MSVLLVPDPVACHRLENRNGEGGPGKMKMISGGGDLFVGGCEFGKGLLDRFEVLVGEAFAGLLEHHGEEGSFGERHRAADVPPGPVGGDERFFLRVEDDHPGDSPPFGSAEAQGDLFPVRHPVGIDL